MAQPNTSRFRVRLFEQRDTGAMIHIFRETAHADLQAAGDPTLHYSSHVWCRPYIALEPEHCFVLTNEQDIAVGYIIGTPDTIKFVEKWENNYTPHLQEEGLLKPQLREDVTWRDGNIPNALKFIMHSPAQLRHDEEPTLVKDYPAHFHIDILPEFQSQGMGRVLIEHFCNDVKLSGASGVYLVRAGDNTGAGAFYERVGFQMYPGVLDEGDSGEKGRAKNGDVWHVKRLQ